MPDPPFEKPGDPDQLLSFATIRSFWTEAGKAAARNLAWLGVWTLLTQLAALVGVYLLTEGLGKERFGVFSFAFAVQAFAYTIGCAGVKQVAVREGARRPEVIGQLFGSHFMLTAGCSVASAVVIILGTTVASMAGISTPGERWLLIIFALGNIANCVNVVSFYDVKHQQPISAFVRFVAEVAAVAVLWRLKATGALALVPVGIVFASKWTFSAIVHYVTYHLRIERIRFEWVGDHARALARSSWPLLVSSLLLLIPFTSGVFFVRVYHGAADTAIFGLAVQVATAYLLFGAIGVRVLQPHIAGRYGMDPRFVRKLIIFSGGYLGVLMLGAWVGATLVIVYLLDPMYRDAVWPAFLVLVGVAFNTTGRIVAMYLIVLHKERTDMICQLAATIAYIVGCLVFVPRFSYYGAAAMAVVANGLGTGLMLIGLLRHGRA